MRIAEDVLPTALIVFIFMTVKCIWSQSLMVLGHFVELL